MIESGSGPSSSSAATAPSVVCSARRRSQLTCGLCHDIYRSPKLLQCLHSYCCRCLENLVQTETEVQFDLIILCPDPLCRREILVPPGGAQNFADNTYLNDHELELARNGQPGVASGASAAANSRDKQQTSRTDARERLPSLNTASTSRGLVRRHTDVGSRGRASAANEPRQRMEYAGRGRVPGGSGSGSNVAARKPPTMCPTHGDTELRLCCVQCEEAACLLCVHTKHMNHQMEDLPQAAQAYRMQLVADHKRLNACVDRLKRFSDLAQSNLQSARQKADTLKEEVKTQHDLLVAMIAEKRDKVLEGLDADMAIIEPILTSDVKRVEEALDSLKPLQRHVGNALTVDSDDVDTVNMAVEMKQRSGSPRELAKFRGGEFKRQFTIRPGLHSYSRTVKKSLESTIIHFFGSPVRLTMLNTETAQCGPFTSPIPFFRCGTHGCWREVHAICRANDGKLHLAYGGKLPRFSEEEKVVITLPTGAMAPTAVAPYTGSPPVPEKIRRKVTFDKTDRGAAPALIDLHNADGSEVIQANSNGNFLIKTRVTQYAFARGPRRYCRKTIIEGKQPPRDADSGTQTFSMEVNNASNPVAFDANANGDLFVIVNEDREEMFLSSLDPNRGVSNVVNTVRLYRKNCHDPIATYTSPSPDPQHFLPLAISFWKHGMQDLLVIADWLNNSVHMVHVNSGSFRFLCYLTAGCGDLVHPTALDVDADKNIWIGCENGCVLKCPFRSGTGDEDIESLLSRILVIQNYSSGDSTPNSSLSSFASGSSNVSLASSNLSDDGNIT